mmetsp:Transcript_307/g.1232  ORF Transcript_307/g.1232 Transcript_307/m.1232 type:complete len:361 (-) Transcript_307:100-1182(-)
MGERAGAPRRRCSWSVTRWALLALLAALGGARAKTTDEIIEMLKDIIPDGRQEVLFERYQAVIRGEWEELDLSFCNLREVPVEAVCHLQDKITSLYLGNNLLTKFPPEVANCLGSTLKKIDLSDNLLTALPDQFDKLKVLSWLRLSNNRFTEFPYPVYSMRKLRRLVLSGNQIEMITENISFLDGLKVLNLGNNNIKELPEEFVELADARVGLYGNPLKVPPLKVAIRGMKAVKTYFEKKRREEEAAQMQADTKVALAGLLGGDQEEDEDEEQPLRLSVPQAQAAPATPTWERFYSEKFKRFYWYNRATQVSTWTDPSGAAGETSSDAEEGGDEADPLASLLQGAVESTEEVEDEEDEGD